MLNTLESRWSLWNLLQGGSMIASFALPAWAVKSVNLFIEFSPLSWVVAGFGGLFIWVSCYLIWQWAKRISINAKYDANILKNGDKLNPLDQTFEGKRIFINDFVLPSSQLIQNKTFINCEIIGPACLYFMANNLATQIKPPTIDGIWLDPSAFFWNGVILSDCIFRDCSFQRITILASVENYESWKNHQNMNWISIPPQSEHLAIRQKVLTPQTNKEEIKEITIDKNDNT
jgi:hypothetical protein